MTDLEFRYEVRNDDVLKIRSLVAGTGFFSDSEADVASELVVERLEKGEASGYSFVLAEEEGELLGYVCFGPIPCTQASYDLYWIAVKAESQGKHIGKRLLAEAEERIRKMGGRRVYIETSSKPQYISTRAFYVKNRYEHAALLPEFYGPGDGKYIYMKVLPA